MQTRVIKAIYPALRDDVENLATVRALPSSLVQEIDPFLFLQHHGPQNFPSHNSGLPFSAHPHRGFQTVTLVLAGDIAHKDSAGNKSVIGAGGVQWMNAGRGVIHEELSSAEFMEHGGPVEILQLWINLPARLKMSEPYYVGLQRGEIPSLRKGGATIQVISGEFEGISGAFEPLTDVAMFTASMDAASELEISIPDHRNVFFYLVRGELVVNGERVKKQHLVEFSNQGEEIRIEAAEDSFLLLAHAKPIGEPIAHGGPFVMNTEKEIRDAFRDYRAGKFG